MIERLLMNRIIEGFQIGEDANCCIIMDGGYVISCQSLLRYVGSDGTLFTNQDHRHQFGLPSPLDCQSEIEKRTKQQAIESVEITPDTGDLTLSLGNGYIEVLCTSAGYENWQLNGPSGFIDRDQRFNR
jgi:hypothetical protein